MTNPDLSIALRAVRKAMVDLRIYRSVLMSGTGEYFTRGAIEDRHKDQQVKQEIARALDHLVAQMAIRNQLQAYFLLENMRANGISTDSLEEEVRDILAGKEVV